MSTYIKSLLERDHGIRFARHHAYDLTVSTERPLPKHLNRLSAISKQGRKTTERRYPWDKMDHGHSFVVHSAGERRSARNSLTLYLQSKKCHLEGHHYMVSQREEDGFGYRCWLVSSDVVPVEQEIDQEPLAVDLGHPIPYRT